MSDLRLDFTAARGGDFAIAANDLVIDDGLVPAMEMSLLLDRRCPADAEIPDGSADQRGWWGNALPDITGDEYGSLLWLLSRQKTTQDVLLKAVSHARHALQWMIDDGIASAVDVVAEFTTPSMLGLQVTVTKPNGASLTQAFSLAWAAQASEVA